MSEGESLWEHWCSELRPQVEARLDLLLRHPAHGAPGLARLREAMRYAVLGGGKRLRPLTLLVTARACGTAAEALLDPACALELVHCYSLVHDDLPGMDDDRQRRGRPTVHVAFDEATAILAGDALLTEAFALLGPQPAAGALVTELAGAAGQLGMVGGQALDISLEGQVPEPDAVLDMYARKTGALFGAACAMGAIAGGAVTATVDALRRFGLEVGQLFQIADDLLGASGDPARTGKPVGRDQERGKPTLLALLGEPATRARAEQLLASATGRLPPPFEVLRGMAHQAWRRRA